MPRKKHPLSVEERLDIANKRIAYFVAHVRQLNRDLNRRNHLVYIQLDTKYQADHRAEVRKASGHGEHLRSQITIARKELAEITIQKDRVVQEMRRTVALLRECQAERKLRQEL